MGPWFARWTQLERTAVGQSHPRRSDRPVCRLPIRRIPSGGLQRKGVLLRQVRSSEQHPRQRALQRPRHRKYHVCAAGLASAPSKVPHDSCAQSMRHRGAKRPESCRSETLELVRRSQTESETRLNAPAHEMRRPHLAELPRAIRAAVRCRLGARLSQSMRTNALSLGSQIAALDAANPARAGLLSPAIGRIRLARAVQQRDHSPEDLDPARGAATA